jgi:hypothetical protein
MEKRTLKTRGVGEENEFVEGRWKKTGEDKEKTGKKYSGKKEKLEKN